jgi:hypothetical protein
MASIAKYSPLQLYKATGNLTGLVEENKLWNAYKIEPDRLPAVIAKAYGMKHGEMGLLEMMTQGKGRVSTKEIKNRKYRWELYTQDDRSIEVVGLLNASATPGLNLEIFYVLFAEKWFELGANLKADDGTMVRVMEDPYQQGTQYVYALQLNSDDRNAYLDPSNLEGGAKFRELWADYEEGSVRGTGVHVSNPAMLENQTGLFRTTVSVTRSAQRAVQFMPIVTLGEGGEVKKSLVWAEEVVWQAMKKHQKSIAISGIYSNLSNHRIGANGRIIPAGAGIRQQIAPANKREFVGEPTFEDFEDFAESLYQNITSEGGEEEVVVLTGIDGMKIAERVIFAEMTRRLGGGVMFDSKHFISETGKDLTLGGYFRAVKLSCGITLKFRNFPLYNDRELHGLINPKTGNPWESSRFTFLNFGTNSNGEANIQKVIPKDAEGIVWTVGGSTDPSGPKKSKGAQGASGYDGFDVHWLDECGYMISDPTTCGEMVPAGLKDF